MLLERREIEARDIIKNGCPHSRRATTYDATVGQIWSDGKSIIDEQFVLSPRGIAWVISEEQFHLPADITGLATLKTHWTHQGVLALNLGIIDPGWKNHVATIIVNFSKSNFEICKGETFFRILFFSHKEAEENSILPNVGAAAYHADIKGKVRLFSDTFLTIDTLSAEIAERILGFPRWAVRIGLAAILAAILAAVLPLAWTAVTQNYVMPSRVDALEKNVSSLEERLQSTQNAIRLPSHAEAGSSNSTLAAPTPPGSKSNHAP